jgi:hypothetical protein
VGLCKLSDGAEVALVVLPRPGPSRSWSSGDVIGSLTVAPLRDRSGTETVADLVAPPLPAAGAGEPVADVLARVRPDQRWIAVLVDGRVTTVIPRAKLAEPTTPAIPSPGADTT